MAAGPGPRRGTRPTACDRLCGGEEHFWPAEMGVRCASLLAFSCSARFVERLLISVCLCVCLWGSTGWV